MTDRGPAMGAGTWTERYETLRRYVLEGRQRLQSQPLGLAVWLAKGMAGWMRQWRLSLEPASAPVSAPPRLSDAQAHRWQQPLSVLLAQMTLPHLEAPLSL
jgi:hypothetical protein